ncbi:Cmx/CmrA family chloramphenicol efflux MFS transporter, partial [Streptomyces muensis]|nr:Cmx/CmrA family chloramphenicol efflux MFS transporter [Streptomyces muensis]
VGGRVADRWPGVVLGAGGVALCLGWGAFALGAGHPAVAFGLVLVQGALAFGVGSTLISQALYAASGAPTLGGGFATAAFNVGAALGPWLGGTAIAGGLGYRSPLWVSAVLVALSLGVAGVAVLGDRRNRDARQGRTPASWSA